MALLGPAPLVVGAGEQHALGKHIGVGAPIEGAAEAVGVGPRRRGLAEVPLPEGFHRLSSGKRMVEGCRGQGSQVFP